jgi:hypothetical protein
MISIEGSEMSLALSNFAINCFNCGDGFFPAITKGISEPEKISFNSQATAFSFSATDKLP